MSESSRAIVPVDTNPIASPSVFGAVDGRVLSALACVDNRMRGSLFIVRVLNSSSYPVFCSIYGESARGITALHPYEFRVDAGGTEDAQIAVPRRAFAPFSRVIVSMRGANLEYKIDARVPAWQPPLGVRAAFAAIVLLAALGVARLGSVTVGAVPADVQTGSIVNVPYDATGIGTVQYTILRDGKAVASGPLAAGRGTLSIASGDRAGTLAASIALSQLGITRTSQSATIAIETPPPPPQIVHFALETVQSHPGDRVRVRYALDAQRATLSLLDARGALLESVPLQRSGLAVLTAPAVDAPSTFALRIDAERGGARTSSTVQLAVAPVPTPSPAPSVPAVRANFAQALAADQFVRLEARYALAGSPLPLRILPHDGALSLTLENPAGKTVATADVAQGATAVSLLVPRIAQDATFLLIVTLQTGQGQQSLLVPVPVRVRP